MSANNLYILGPGGTPAFFQKMDLGSNTFSTEASCPPAPQSDTANLAFDGTYVYAVIYVASVNGMQLVRYNPATNLWSSALGGNFSSPGVAGQVSLACDGTYVYAQIDGNLYAYKIDNDTMTLIGAGAFDVNAPQLVWDQGTNLYVFQTQPSAGASPFNTSCLKFNLLTRTLASYPMSGLPAAGGGGTAFVQGVGYNSGNLYAIFDNAGTYQVYTGSDNGTQITWTLAAAIGTALTNAQYGGMVSATVFAIVANKNVYLVNVTTGAVTTVATGATGLAAVGIPVAYTVNVTPFHQFLESDGLTPVKAIEPFGGPAATYLPGTTNVFAYNLKALLARNDITLQVVADVANPLEADTLLSTSPTGPWTTSVDLGTFAQGQVKPFYVQVAVPGGQSPATYYPFIIEAQSAS